MTQYLISFGITAMDHIPEADMPAVGAAARAVVQEAKDAGVFVFTGGLNPGGKQAAVGTDGVVTDGPYPESKELVGGIFVVEVPTWEAALQWAAKIATACRCPQHVHEFFPFRRPDLEIPH
jgi:hypothetical protein